MEIGVAGLVVLLLVSGAAGIALWHATSAPDLPGGVETDGAVLARHGYRMVRIGPGTFQQGGIDTDPDRMDDEVRRNVGLTRGFSLGATEVTGRLYADVMGADPSSRPCEDCPVTDVSWRDAALFCNALSAREGLRQAYVIDAEQVTWTHDSDGYRLPTEAEWEYAANATAHVRFAGGDHPDPVAWFADNSSEMPHPVGRRRPNAWGLYDMSGNVWEWVWDRYGLWSSDTVADPTGPEDGVLRVGKGGAWNTWGDMVRVAARSRGTEDSRGDILGFRIARTTE